MPSSIQPTPPLTSVELLALALAVAIVAGAFVPDLCTAIASTVLRSFGEDVPRRATRTGERLAGASVCAAAAIVACATSVGRFQAIADWLLCFSLLIASEIDRRHHLLPDVLTLPLLLAGLLLGAIVTPLPDAVIGAVAGYLGLRALSHALTIAADAEGIGHGDFKLLASLGAWLGWQSLFPVVLIAATLAVVTGLLHAARAGVRSLPRMAFGPSLAAAAVVVMFVPALRWWHFA